MTTALSVAGSQPALIKMTRAEAYSKIRSAAADEYANARTTQATDRAQFERNYGSTSELDQSFVNDMRAMMLRASAIAISAGGKKNAYDATVVPNKTLEKVAAILAGAVGECELYLATRKARSMFAPPQETEFVAQAYGGKVDNPYSWVGDRARHVVDRVLEGVQIIDDGSISSIRELELAVKKNCQHEMIGGHPDDESDEQFDAKCEYTGGTWMKCRLGCGRHGREYTLHGEKVFVVEGDLKSVVDVESLCKDGVMYLPDGMTLDEYEKLPKKKRADVDAKIGEMLDGEGGE